ncbi:putative caib baif family enzyme protein [Chaetomidium leptoderma]|uniref:Caib baif family enzyme protein n=1 Tax=Chaetomidium leptoderma TaxID=669021 RepID=A0AAN6VDI9_9PEZI|nr:putative caib baif family enzyme protein [Chaetomidium leptoderma]
MGKVMGCGGVCAIPESAEALSIVRHDSFDIRPISPAARCTPLSVAAHTLYEKARPNLLAGPGGLLNVRQSRFEQLQDGRTVRVTGSKFLPVVKGAYTIKLEGARVVGYTAMFVGGIRDPIMISQLDRLVPLIQERLRAMLQLRPAPPPGYIYLASLASVIRTKNCGPFQLTMDVFFSCREKYDQVHNAEVLNTKTIARLYDVAQPQDIHVCLWCEPALAFKATIKRPAVSGSFRDSDAHGSGWHVALMYLQIPERF